MTAPAGSSPGEGPGGEQPGGAASLLVLARAKLNLSLRVLAREESGFHQIETVFCAIELADEVEVGIECDDGVRLHVASPPEAAAPPPDLGPEAANLAVRAAHLFFAATGLPARAWIRLTKRIPAGAGLGGGSSDAAAVLAALNRLHGSPLALPQLVELGGALGSDVPFLVAGAPLALAWGRGTRMLHLPPLPTLPVLLAVPAVGVSTAEAYAALAAARGHGHAAPPRLLAPPRDWDDVARDAVNDFEGVCFARYPELAAVRQAMEEEGALVARMTGSGSVLFGVYPDATAAAVRDRLAARFAELDWLLTRTAGGVPPADLSDLSLS